MRHFEVTDEAISVSDQRDVVLDAIESAVRATVAAATKGSLLGKPNKDKIAARVKEMFFPELKKALERDVSAITNVLFTDANVGYDAAVNQQTGALILNRKHTDRLADWIVHSLSGGGDVESAVRDSHSTANWIAERIVHEIVHLEQAAREPQKEKSYTSYLAKTSDQLWQAVENLASKENYEMYLASPQEIPAFAHQMVYRAITQALGGQSLKNIAEDEIPYVIQELKDVLKDISSGMSASDETLGRYLNFKGNDKKRMKVFKRFMKSVYQEVASYIEKLQAGYRGQQQKVTETFDNPYYVRTSTGSYGSIHYGFNAQSKDGADNPIDVGFYRVAGIGPNGWGIVFEDERGFAASGKGDAFRIFATVVYCLEKFLNSTEGKQAEHLTFSVDDNKTSRLKLYDRFAKMMPEFGFEIDKEKTTQLGKKYVFKRRGYEPPPKPALIPPEEQIEETFDSHIVMEIDGAHELADMSPELEKTVIAGCKHSGEIMNREVCFYNNGGDLIVFFKDEDQIDALVWIKNKTLYSMKNNTNNKGLIYALFHYIIDIEGMPIRLAETDKLTRDGLKWIIGQIKRGGFKITDQHGKPVDPSALEQEWKNTFAQGKHGPTAITIAESARAEEIRENETSLMKYDIYGVHCKEDLTYAQESRGNFKNVLRQLSPEKRRMVGLSETRGYHPSMILQKDDLVLWKLGHDLFTVTESDAFNIVKTSKVRKEARDFVMSKSKSNNLEETFDAPYSTRKQISDGGNRVAYLWNTDDNRVGVCNFWLQDSDALEWGMEFDIDLDMSASGGGDAFKIFATVAQCLKDFVASTPDVNGLSFAGDKTETSRLKLYDRFAKMIPGITGFKNKNSNFETGNYKFYEFEKSKKPALIPPEEQIEESDLTEIERVGAQNFPLNKVEEILQQCSHKDGDTIDGFDAWFGRNGDERYVVLTDSSGKIASYAGFKALEPNRWQAKNTATYSPFRGNRLASKIYRELTNHQISILSDIRQSPNGERLWTSSLPKLGLNPMVFDFDTNNIYRPDQIGDKIYSTDPKIKHRYCWILEWNGKYADQNLVYENKMLMPLQGLWYTKRVRFSESASGGCTSAGGIATVSQPLGSMVRRPGSSILAGINTAEEFPNTPPWMQAYKKKSQNKKRSK